MNLSTQGTPRRSAGVRITAGIALARMQIQVVAGSLSGCRRPRKTAFAAIHPNKELM